MRRLRNADVVQQDFASPREGDLQALPSAPEQYSELCMRPMQPHLHVDAAVGRPMDEVLF
jgi:hypothetical protein